MRNKLKNKSYRSEEALSRYSSLPYYYNEDTGRYVYGLGQWLGQEVSYVSHEVKHSDTLDSISLKYYGRPDYYWVIASFNRIHDSFIELDKYYVSIAVPTLANISFERVR